MNNGLSKVVTGSHVRITFVVHNGSVHSRTVGVPVGRRDREGMRK